MRNKETSDTIFNTFLRDKVRLITCEEKKSSAVGLYYPYMNRLLTCLFIVVVSSSFGQNLTSYSSLLSGRSARDAALGGNITTLGGASDPNLSLFTPSLISKEDKGSIMFNYVNYFADINMGYLGYSGYSDRACLGYTGGLRFLSYGKIQTTDETGAITGETNAGEWVFQGGVSKELSSRWTAGGNLKFLLGQLESFKSTAISTDLALSYTDTANLLQFTILASDLGFVLSDYNGNESKLPYNLSIGFSKKLAKSPLRFFFSYQYLNQWDIRNEAEKEESPSSFGLEDNSDNRNEFLDMFMRHFGFGTEIVLSKSFQLRVGYNYKRRQELKIDEKSGTTGLSWGFAFRVAKFHLSYARATYHLSGASNHFTISSNLNSFVRR